MNDINQLTISGRLTKDVELKSTNGGTYFVRGSIASNHSIKKGDTWEEKPGFFDFVCWKHNAEYLHKYAKKGDTLIIAGPIRWQSWETQSGEKRSKVEINADQIIIKPKREGAEPQGSAAAFDSAHMADESIPF